MIFEDFVNDIKAINKIVKDEDIRDIVSYIGSIEKKLNKDEYKENIRKIENLFKVFNIKEK